MPVALGYTDQCLADVTSFGEVQQTAESVPVRVMASSFDLNSFAPVRDWWICVAEDF